MPGIKLKFDHFCRNGIRPNCPSTSRDCRQGLLIYNQRMVFFESDERSADCVNNPGLQEIVEERRGKNLHFSTDISTAIKVEWPDLVNFITKFYTNSPRFGSKISKSGHSASRRRTWSSSPSTRRPKTSEQVGMFSIANSEWPVFCTNSTRKHLFSSRICTLYSRFQERERPPIWSSSSGRPGISPIR